MTGELPAAPAAAPIPAQWWLRLAHDLRGPVAPMRMAVQMLRTGLIGPAEQPEALCMVDRQIDLLLESIEQFGDLLRINAGKFEMRRERSDLGDVFALLEGRSALRRELDQRGVTLVAEPLPTPLLALYDGRRLASVLEFLVLKFAKSASRGSDVRVALRGEGPSAIWSIHGDTATLADDIELQWVLGGSVGLQECEAQAVLAREIAKLSSLQFSAFTPGAALEIAMPIEP